MWIYLVTIVVKDVPPDPLLWFIWESQRSRRKDITRVLRLSLVLFTKRGTPHLNYDSQLRLTPSFLSLSLRTVYFVVVLISSILSLLSCKRPGLYSSRLESRSSSWPPSWWVFFGVGMGMCTDLSRRSIYWR